MFEKTKRIYSFDVLRILASCAVIMIHTSADIIKEFDNNTTDFILGNALNSLSRFAVPVFLMISGALMLDEDKKISTKKMMKSTLNILTLTFIWSLLYSLAYHVIRPIVFGETISTSNIVNAFFNGHYHMWFLYVLVGLYLITPLLRFFVKKENSILIRNYLLFSIIICFVFSFINAFCNIYFSAQDKIIDFINNFRFDYIYEYIIYYIIGWYIANVDLKKSLRVIIYIAGFASLVITFIGTQVFYTPESDNYFYANNSLNVFLYSIAIFTFVYYLFKNKKIVLNSFWTKISNLTFGVYLIHCTYLFGLKMILASFNVPFIKMFAIFIACILLSFLTTFIFSKIPIIKKLVRG